MKSFLSSLVKKSSYCDTLTYRKNCAYWEHYTQIFSLIIIAAFPLMIGINGYVNVTERKYLIFLTITYLYFGVILFILSEYILNQNFQRIRKEEGFQRLGLPQFLLIGFTVWGIICALVSPYSNLWEGQSRYEGVLSMILYSTVFILVALWGEYSDFYLPAISVTITIESVICILQIFNVDLFYPEGYSYINSNFLGTLGNIDMIGGLVAITIPALVCGFIILDTKWRYLMLLSASLLFSVEIHTDVDSGKLGLLVAFAFSAPFLLTCRKHIVNALFALSAFVFTFAVCRYIVIPNVGEAAEYSLSFNADKVFFSAIAVALLLFIVALLLNRKQKELPWSERTMRLCIIGLEAVALIGALIFLYGYSGTTALLQNASDLLHGHFSDEAGSGRGFIWKACFQLIAEAPIFGYGPGAFAEVFSPYNAELGVVFDFAHNDFLHIGVSMGCVGLALYLAFVAVLAVRAIKAAPHCPLIVIFASSVAGYLAHSFFSFSIAIISPLFWVMAGLTEKLIRQTTEKFLPHSKDTQKNSTAKSLKKG